MPVTYECTTIDNKTKLCTHWQPVEQTPPIAKEDANAITMAVITFLAYVFVIKQIKRML